MLTWKASPKHPCILGSKCNTRATTSSSNRPKAKRRSYTFLIITNEHERVLTSQTIMASWLTPLSPFCRKREAVSLDPFKNIRSLFLCNLSSLKDVIFLDTMEKSFKYLRLRFFRNISSLALLLLLLQEKQAPIVDDNIEYTLQANHALRPTALCV